MEKEVKDIDRKENLIRLIGQYNDLIFSICLKLTGDYFISEDITQETFLSAFHNWNKFDGSNEKAWLCRIASNKCIDWRRSAARKYILTNDNESGIESADCSHDPLQLFIAGEITDRLAEACRNLPEPYRETAEMYFIGSMTARQIAEHSGIKIKTVQSRIRKAKEMLKHSIKKEDLLT